MKNIGAHPDQEYFADGMTEEIINGLTKVAGLKVTARTSSFAFKNVAQDVREIGAKLGVSLILEGSIRTFQNQIRMTINLIRTEDGFNVWSEVFDRELTKIFALQDEISVLIVDKIRENYGHLTVEDRLIAIHTENVAAYQQYLKGRYFYNSWDMEGFQKAAAEFEQSIAIDETFDLPYFGAGLSYSFLGSWGAMNREEAFERVNHFFSKGNHLNLKSHQKYYSIAKHLFWGQWKFTNAFEFLSLAYELLPQDASNNEFMAEMQALAGNFITAKKYIDTSLKINPLSPTHYYTKAQILFVEHHLEEALAVLDKGIAIDPNFAISQELLISCLILLGDRERFHQAIPYFDEDTQRLFQGVFQLKYDAVTFDNSLLEIVYSKVQKPLLAWDLYILVQSEKYTEALTLLTTKVASKMGQILYLKYDPWLQPLYGNETFRDIVLNHFSEEIIIPQKQKKAKNIQLTPSEIDHFTKKLMTLLETEKIYLDSSLGLKDLASKLKLHPNKLSWLLNEKIGKNFYELVNSYRLQEFQQLALQPKNSHLSILGLAYDSGFNSKSVFNDYFKKTIGVTPKAWIKQQQ